MDGKELDKVMAFDTLFTTNHIQMMKVLMTYLDPYIQKTLAMYIKIMELQYTFSFFHTYPNASMQGFPHEESFNTEKLLNEMLPFCTPSEQNNLSQIKGMFQNFASMQEMMQMVQSMKELFPEGEGNGQGDISGILSALGGMAGLSPDGMDLSMLMNLFQANKE